MSSELRSTRRPWIRSGLMELDSCGHAVPLEKELTGLMVFGRFDVEGWLLVACVMLVALIAPYPAALRAVWSTQEWLRARAITSASKSTPG